MKHNNIHYRTNFYVEFKGENEATLIDYLIRMTGTWLYHKYKNETSYVDGLISKWLFLGGNWKHNIKGLTVKTSNYEDDAFSPSRFWALKLYHKDDKFRSRNWCTDIAFSQIDRGKVHVSFTVSHFLDKSFLGIEPQLPASTSPNLVKTIISDERLRSYSGVSLLRAVPITLNLGMGRDFIEEIQSQHRTLPIVLVKRNEFAEIQISCEQMALALAGNANVYILEDSRIEEELAYYFKGRIEGYRCPWNAVRIYLPGLNSENQFDSKRHRFFFFRDFVDDVSVLIRIVTRGLSKTFALDDPECISSIDDIDVRIAQRRLSQLQENRSDYDTSEYIALLEAENTRLTFLEKENDKELGQLGELVDRLTAENDDLTRSLKYKENLYNEVLARRPEELFGSGKILVESSQFEKLPRSVSECVLLIRQMLPSRVVFLEEAVESAARFECIPVDQAWEVLWSVVTVLYEICFELNESENLVKSFRDRSGYELTLSESSMTRADQSLMKSRVRNYNGIEIDISPHVKYDKGKCHFRVHFYLDKLNKKVVIGHCGDHLTTAGTKRRKEG